jgi:hypothetical protein
VRCASRNRHSRHRRGARRRWRDRSTARARRGAFARSSRFAFGAVGADHHAGVLAEAHADAAAVVERHPGRAGRGVEQRVQQRPVGDGVGAVLHRLGLAVGRGDRAAVEVVAADDDRGLQFAAGDHLVEGLRPARAGRRARSSRCAPAGPERRSARAPCRASCAGACCRGTAPSSFASVL